MNRLLVLAVLLSLSAGCLSDAPEPREPGGDTGVVKGPRLGADAVAEFSAPLLIDSLRAGGEPVIAVTPKGAILVSAHPGYTHWHPSPDAVPPTSAELLVPTQAQSYMWRSTDGGRTFKVVTLLPVENPPNAGPRGVGQGVSDPDFAIDSEGRIYFTDLEALASASVSWSDDDGATWLMGDNLASGGVIDRQWLATFGTKVYFRGNYFGAPQDVRVSEDRGRTWRNVGISGCGGDIVVNPLDGHLFVGCSTGLSVSTDGGATWEGRSTGIRSGGPIESEPAIDANGTVYRAFDPRRSDMVVAYSKDEGVTWANYSLKSFFPELGDGTLIWPWASAGSGGRLSVTFYASPLAEAATSPGGEWFVYNAIILGADTDSPMVYPTKVTPSPFHRGPMCQGGTACQATTAASDGSDRRLGDFFETTIDHEGFVHIAYADTQTRPDDTISHVGYARLLGGPRLVEGELPAGFPTQG